MSMITSATCRAARGLLGWTQRQLAEAAKVGLSTVNGFEANQTKPISANLAAIQAAFETAGVEFTNGGQPGVRMKAAGD